MFPDRYQILGHTLDGGMGSVHLCYDQTLERKVAIKVIHNPKNERRIIDEVDALLKLRSKHVVQVYDIIRVGKGKGIVQEYVEGSDLWETPDCTLSSGELCKQLWQIASGIEDIHRAGVIHRDIKPNNIKNDLEGVIKIFDFGLARDEGMSASTVGFVGTFGFAAPELFDDNPKFTTAVDVYGFGATAFHLIAGGLPKYMQKPTRPVELPSNSLDEFKCGLPDSALRVIESCLAVEVNARPTMTQVRETLAKDLLRNRHRALLVHKGEASYLHSERKAVRASWDGVGSITIRYDGLVFFAGEVEGDVYINYAPAVKGQELPGSCVIALGAPTRGATRMFLTFDVSHPEVIV